MDLILFGIQGSGKGTQAKRLASEMKYQIFEAGAELRAIAASGTELGSTVAGYINEGHLVPFEIIMQVVRSSVENAPRDQTILFDGVPRDMDQMHAFNEIMQQLGRDFIVLHLTVDEEEALQRILQRAKEQNRADDASEQSIRRRMDLFHQKTEPVIRAYAEQGKVLEVNGEGTMDEVYERIEKALSVAV